ncbi:hypothetical protein C8R44DRAFT_749147 [Mycena epipterygia]|nr:hypothetical protein C8R44DRAFT_749147 [Mycena epipterygia]
MCEALRQVSTNLSCTASVGSLTPRRSGVEQLAQRWWLWPGVAGAALLSFGLAFELEAAIIKRSDLRAHLAAASSARRALLLRGARRGVYKVRLKSNKGQAFVIELAQHGRLAKESKADIEATATTDAANAAATKITITAACELDLAAINMADPAEDAPTTSSLTAKCIGSHCDGVDITNPFFRDLLVDRPIPGANAIGGLADCRSRPSRAPKTRKKRLVTLRGQGRIINRALEERLPGSGPGSLLRRVTSGGWTWWAEAEEVGGELEEARGQKAVK